ncbi:MAG: hypothetical protein WCD53_04755 [Microcoleus sp.]
MYSQPTPQQLGNPVNLEIGLTEGRLIDRSQISSSKARPEAMYFIK